MSDDKPSWAGDQEMRSSIHGTFATFLLLIPVGIIPTLAIFGIPQFAPVVASPLSDGNENEYDSSEANSGNRPAEGLYQDLDSFHSTNEDVVHVTDPMKESAAIPNRSVPRENRTRNREANERTVISNSRLPSWAKDLPSKDSRQTTTALRDAVPFEGASSRRDVLPQGESSPRVSDSFASSRNMESNSDEFQRTEQTNDHHIRPLANDVEERVALPSQRRSRGTPQEQGVAPSRENSGSEPLTWQGAVQRLNELEIRNFRLEPGREVNQFVFICSYSSSDSPRVLYRFEAEADEPLKAVEKVLLQVDEWQRRR
jgi:hypothetical protein